jgi:hypothetical protein
MDDREQTIIRANAKRAACRRKTVETLLQAKCRIQGCMMMVQESGKDHTEDVDLIELYDHIVTYLAKHCDHEWTEDLIDIDGDRSQQIVYCNFCETVQK